MPHFHRQTRLFIGSNDESRSLISIIDQNLLFIDKKLRAVYVIMRYKVVSYIFVQKIFMYKVLLLLFFGLIITSCNSDTDAGEFVVGSDYLSVNNKVILIDTLTVDVSTINFDSLVTSSQSRILVGNYDDPIFGKVKSDSYFQLSAFKL